MRAKNRVHWGGCYSHGMCLGIPGRRLPPPAGATRIEGATQTGPVDTPIRGRANPEGGHMETMEPLDTSWNGALWQQFGAAIDMFDNAVVACPDSLWRERLWSAPADDPQSPFGEVWRIAYHTLYWLDLYLSSIANAPGVTPPSPFPAPSLDAEDDPPERPYTKDELRTYLAYTRQKCQDTIATLV